MNRISFLNRSYAFKGLLAVLRGKANTCVTPTHEQLIPIVSKGLKKGGYNTLTLTSMGCSLALSQ